MTSAVVLHSLALLLTVAAATATFALAAPFRQQSNSFMFAGPTAATGFEVGDHANDNSAVALATNAIVYVPSDNSYVIATNGGVYKTKSALDDPYPTWVSVSDGGMTSTAIASLHVSRYNSSRVYAGSGAMTASVQGFAWNVRNDAGWTGIGFSEDSGNTWRMMSFPPGYSVENILETKSGALLVAVRGSYTNQQDGGIWRCASWNNPSPSCWKRVFSISTFTFALLSRCSGTADAGAAASTDDMIFASTGESLASAAVFASIDDGQTFTAFSAGIAFIGDAELAMFSTFSIANASSTATASCLSTPTRIFYSTLLSTNRSDADNAIDRGFGADLGVVYVADIPAFGTAITPASLQWKRLGGQPMEAGTPPGVCCNTLDCCTWPLAKNGKPRCCMSFGSWSVKSKMAIMADDAGATLYVALMGMWWPFRVDVARALAAPDSVCELNMTEGARFPCRGQTSDPPVWQSMVNRGSPWSNDVAACKNGALDCMNDPHVDPRCFLWAPASSASISGAGGERILLLTSDGGVFKRYRPSSHGEGGWRDWVGGSTASGTPGLSFEFVHASMTTVNGSRVFIGCAQDNDCMIGSAKTPGARAVISWAFDGDGQWTAVSPNPSRPGSSEARLFGNTQYQNNLGYYTVNEKNLYAIPVSPTVATQHSTPIRLSAHGLPALPSRRQAAFPYMQLSFEVTGDGQKVLLWSNQSATQSSTGGLFEIDLTAASNGAPAQLVVPLPPPGVPVLAFAVSDDLVASTLAVATDTNLLIKQRPVVADGTALTPDANSTPVVTIPYPRDVVLSRPCATVWPQHICAPGVVGWGCQYVSECQSWPTHTATATVAVWRNQMVAVTGWQKGAMESPDSIYNTNKNEILLLTSTISVAGGAEGKWTRFVDIFSNMQDACVGLDTSVARARPTGLAFVGPPPPPSSSSSSASGTTSTLATAGGTAAPLFLLAGTTRGLCAAIIDGSLVFDNSNPNSDNGSSYPATYAVTWRRVTPFPLVKVMSIKYMQRDDIVVVATMGRGIFTMEAAYSSLASQFNITLVDASASNGGAGGVPVGLIVGVVVGGVVLLICVVAAVVWWRQRAGIRMRDQEKHDADFREFRASTAGREYSTV